VTAYDTKSVPAPSPSDPNFFSITGDIGSEISIAACITSAVAQFGAINILVVNTDINDEFSEHNTWDIPLDDWGKFYSARIRGTLLFVKHFLHNASEAQHANNAELENLAIVIAGSGTGNLGQSSQPEYASPNADLQSGLVRRVQNEIAKINSRARINAVTYWQVDNPLASSRLDVPREADGQLRTIAQPRKVARTIAFLGSHRVAQHITGQHMFIGGGIGSCAVWRAGEVWQTENEISNYLDSAVLHVSGPLSTSPMTASKRRIQVLLSVDFDAVSGFLGTGASAGTNLADYSSGFFAAQVGVPRLLRLFKKHGIAASVTWFVPGHSMESFPNETKAIVESGAEIACHGYAHEGSAQMTPAQERDVITRCVNLVTELTGSKPRGWRAPLYQLREHTIEVLEELGFLYGMCNHAQKHPSLFLVLVQLTGA
jgi:NAD(P)-dependent dehydrogenase (short-subunit alcohol dehydrogenase family)